MNLICAETKAVRGWLAGMGLAIALWCACVPAALAALGTGTNSTPRWPPLAEVLKKWADTPLDAVQRAAEGGDLTAQHYLGYCYTEGLRTGMNLETGIAWYERAFKAGYAPSGNNLGLVYQRSLATNSNNASKMVHYYRAAAGSGSAVAQANLGILYRDGLGVPRDPAEAMNWFRQAADQDNLTAIIEIGRLYRFGRGVPKNVPEALRWFQRAADREDRLGLLNLGWMHGYEAETPINQQTALQYYERAAGLGEPEAMYELYFSYRDGKGVGVDKSKAMEWLRKAAEGGCANAQYLLGYENGHTIGKRDVAEAIKWWTRAAEQNHLKALDEMADVYLNGDGVEQDEERALEFVRKAADLDYGAAQFKLAWMYSQDIGEPRNEQDRPFNLLLHSAANGDGDGCLALSLRYRDGLGTQRDFVEAAGWRFRAVLVNLMRFGHNDPEVLQVFRKAGPTDPFSTVLLLFGNAARGGDPGAFKQIGNLYLEGKDVQRNPARAQFWFALAATGGNGAAESPPAWFKQWNEEAQAAREVIGVLRP